MATSEFDDEVLITGYEPAAQFLTEHGFPTSKSLLSKVGSPAVGEGPEVVGYWNGRPSFRPSALLAWARRRMKPSKTVPTIAVSSSARGRGRPRKPTPHSIPSAEALSVQPEPVAANTSAALSMGDA